MSQSSTRAIRSVFGNSLTSLAIQTEQLQPGRIRSGGVARQLQLPAYTVCGNFCRWCNNYTRVATITVHSRRGVERLIAFNSLATDFQEIRRHRVRERLKYFWEFPVNNSANVDSGNREGKRHVSLHGERRNRFTLDISLLSVPF